MVARRAWRYGGLGRAHDLVFGLCRRNPASLESEYLRRWKPAAEVGPECVRLIGGQVGTVDNAPKSAISLRAFVPAPISAKVTGSVSS